MTEIIKPLDVLVVEDNPMHLKSVKQLTDVGHRVDTAQCLVEAVGLLGVGLLGDKSDAPVKYDAVLTDMMLPMGGQSGSFGRLGDERQRYNPAPLGYAIALAAAKKGVPYIAIVTDSNHHDGPIPASFDMFYQDVGKWEWKADIFTVNNSKLALFNDICNKKVSLRKDGTIGAFIEGDDEQAGLKNWLGALNFITGQA